MDDFWWYMFLSHFFKAKPSSAVRWILQPSRVPHRVWRRALGPTGVGAGRFQHAKEAVEEQGRGDGDVHEKTQ